MTIRIAWIALFLTLIHGYREVEAQPTSFQVERISKSLESKDPFVSLKFESPKGTLSYAYPTANSMVSLVKRKFTGETKQAFSSILRLPPSNIGASIFDVTASPTTDRIAFKYGVSYSGDSEATACELYILDLSQKRVEKVANVVAQREISWSPNGVFLAFWRASQSQRKGTKWQMDLSLGVFNTTNKKPLSITPKMAEVNSFSWSLQNALFYSGFQSAESKANPRPSLFKFTPTNGRVVKMFNDCYKPVISPDGKRVAFFGSEKVSRSKPPVYWRLRANYSTLCVSDIDGKNRFGINAEKGDYPRVFWANNSVMVSSKQVKGGPSAQLDFTGWNTTNGRIKWKNRLVVRDVAKGDFNELYNSEPLNRPDIWARFEIFSSYSDPSIGFVNAMQLLGLTPNGVSYRSQNLIYRIDFDSGQIVSLGMVNFEQNSLQIKWN